MSFLRRIRVNIAFYSAGQIISAALSLVSFIFIARYLGPENFGVLSFALALYYIFGVLTDFGLRQIATREIAREKHAAARYISNVFGIKIILSALVLALLVIFIHILGYPAQTRQVVYWISLAVVFNTFSQGFYTVFQAYERMEFESFGLILQSIALIGAVFLTISRNLTVVSFAFFYSLASAVPLIFSFSVSWLKFVKPGIDFNFGFWKSSLKEAFPFGLIVVLGIFYHWIATVMLSIMKGDAAVGIYSVAYRLVLVLLIVPSAFDMAIFPVISRLYPHSAKSIQYICERAFNYLSFFSIPVSIAVVIMADKIIVLFFGNAYLDSVIALKILIWSVIFIFAGTPFSDLLGAINKQSILARIIGGSVVLNIILNIILIPKYSYIGSSIATVISAVFIFSGIIIASSKNGYKASFSNMIFPVLKSVITGCLLGIFILCFRNINIFLLAFFSGTLWFVLIYLMKGLRAEDFGVIKNIINS